MIAPFVNDDVIARSVATKQSKPTFFRIASLLAMTTPAMTAPSHTIERPAP